MHSKYYKYRKVKKNYILNILKWEVYKIIHAVILACTPKLPELKLKTAYRTHSEASQFVCCH